MSSNTTLKHNTTSIEKDLCHGKMNTNRNVLNMNPTYRIVSVIINLVLYIFLPTVLLTFTNMKVYQKIKIHSKNMERNLSDRSLRDSVLKAKFCILVAILFVISNASKAIGAQGFYSLCAVIKGKNYLFCMPYWVKLCDAFAYQILTVLNSSSNYYVYKWLKKRNKIHILTKSVLLESETANPRKSRNNNGSG